MLPTLTGLTHLSLRGCQQLSDTALLHVAALSALQHLNLTACERISGECSVLLDDSHFHCRACVSSVHISVRV